MTSYPKIAQLKTVEALRARLSELDLKVVVDDHVLSAAAGSPLAKPLEVGSFQIGNRWCIHPMEGWDANQDGSPSELTLHRWHNFGRSGAKLIWGGEAAAVQRDGRANPHQTLAIPENRDGLRTLLTTLRSAHLDCFGTTDDLLVGLQLTHSGRFCRPNSKSLEPRIAYHHPLLDEKFGIEPTDEGLVWTDDDLHRLIDNYVLGARLAQEVGFQFVDIKACHGYLLHEFLSSRIRPGEFGGDFDGRTKLLRTIVARIRDEIPALMIGVRLSVFDTPPYQTGHAIGQPMNFQDLLPYKFGFGVDENNPLCMDLTEPLLLIRQLVQLGVVAINVSCGSPYYNPHAQRPAIFPPSDGYLPPEDPLVGVVRQLQATQQCKEAFPALPIIGSGYSYLQDFLPHVAQSAVRQGWVDAVGIGRMVLSYPELPDDCLKGRKLQRKQICRTFSECTTAPRHGLVSGCFPLDTHYKQLPQANELKVIKRHTKDTPS